MPAGSKPGPSLQACHASDTYNTFVYCLYSGKFSWLDMVLGGWSPSATIKRA